MKKSNTRRKKKKNLIAEAIPGPGHKQSLLMKEAWEDIRAIGQNAIRELSAVVKRTRSALSQKEFRERNTSG